MTGPPEDSNSKPEPSNDHPSPAGDAALLDAYAHLRRIAQRLMNAERAGHTLSATEVVHEAMARLLEHEGWRVETMTTGPQFLQFVRHAAHAMQQVLVDHARRRGAVKRGGDRKRVDFENITAEIDSPALDWLALHEALEEMRDKDARRHSIVLLKFFAGLDNREIARQLEVDERTVGRDWASAKLWLRQRLESSER